MALEFRLFGNIAVQVDGKPVDIGYAQLQAMLTVLLMEANRLVTVDQLVERVWGERRLPKRPRGAIQHNIAVLRNRLGPSAEVDITWQGNGYLLTADPDSIDVHRFQRLVNQARTTGDRTQAAALLDHALRLWLGEPFTGLDTPWLTTSRTMLDHLRHAARLDLTDIQLRQGMHAALLPELLDRARLEPLNERLAGQLMLALYQDGRAAQALGYYQQLRGQLADDLGVDPSLPLRRLYQQILAADSALTAGTAAAAIARPPAPRQLPAPPRLFTGRARELADLTAALGERTELGKSMALAVISGPAGVGKSWLALHWAHQHLDRFPDGQLYIDLRGFDAGGQPLSPAVAVRAFLGALGIAPDAVPSELETQIGLYRSVVADKRILILLDNARDTAQVAPLLPGSRTCTVLTTSRHCLDGLVTGHGAAPLPLDMMTEVDARRLLARLLRSNRVSAKPAAVDDLLTYCMGLPLAISVVAARAVRHPDVSLSALAAELRDRSGRLAALDTGDPHASLSAVLSWSCHALSAAASAAFTLLGLACGQDIGLPAAATLLSMPTSGALAVLRELEHAHLVQQHVPGRFRMHDLVRLYAAQRAQRHLPGPARSAAMRRLVDFYLHTAHAAGRLLQPLLPSIQLTERDTGRPPDPIELHDQATALAWFAQEQSNLLATQQLAAAEDWVVASWQLAWLLTSYLYRQGHFQAALTAWKAGQAAACQLDDPAVHTGTHQLLGAILTELGLHTEALHHLTLAERDSDLPAQAYTDHALGWSWSLRGDDRRALKHAARALHRYRAAGLVAGEIRELTFIGWYQARLGDFEAARSHCDTALASARQHGFREDEGLATGILGFVAQHTGRYRTAIDLYHRARAVLRAAGNTNYEATVLEFLGDTHLTLGQSECAHAAWWQALELFNIQHRTTDTIRLRQRLEGLDPPPRMSTRTESLACG